MKTLFIEFTKYDFELILENRISKWKCDIYFKVENVKLFRYDLQTNFDWRLVW